MTAPRTNTTGRLTVPLTDGRIHYKSEISPETEALWQRVEDNRQAFLREVPEAKRERFWSGAFKREDLNGMSGAAVAHILFCAAVSKKTCGTGAKTAPHTNTSTQLTTVLLVPRAFGPFLPDYPANRCVGGGF